MGADGRFTFLNYFFLGIGDALGTKKIIITKASNVLPTVQAYVS